jgi:hypothetical protein
MSLGKLGTIVVSMMVVVLFSVGCGEKEQARQPSEEEAAAANDTLDGDLFASAARNVQQAVKDANESLQRFAERVDTTDVSQRIDQIARNAREQIRDIAQRVDEEIPRQEARARIDSIAQATRQQIDALVDSVQQTGDEQQ